MNEIVLAQRIVLSIAFFLVIYGIGVSLVEFAGFPSQGSYFETEIIGGLLFFLVLSVVGLVAWSFYKVISDLIRN